MTTTAATDVDRRLDLISSRLDDLVADAERRRGREEGAVELVSEMSSMGRPAFELLTARLAELERRGYFEFARSGVGVMDRVVTSFTEEDVEALGDNIVLILETVKEMTQPDIMRMLRRTFHTVQDEGPAEPPSLLSLLRQLRDPAVRLGLARILSMLRSVGGDLPTVADNTTKEV